MRSTTEMIPRSRRLDERSLWRFAGLAGLASLATLGFANIETAEAERPVATMPVSEIRPGMRGHALTVFQGEETDKFEIEIVDVVPHYLPKQDGILFRSTDPRMMHSGIVGGMSGSPIYIDGKLVGALAYGWRFNKDPLGAITPIEDMQEVGALPYRPDALPSPKIGRSRSGTHGWADTMLGLETSALPERIRPSMLDPTASLVPLETPLSISGLGTAATQLVADTLGLLPVRGGGRGRRQEATAEPPKPKQWAGGDSVSVVMIEGDSAVAGNGTVTWVNGTGDRLLAFGHSMLDEGPSNVPMADARVHTIVSSVDRSVKLSSPLAIRGLMYQDRQAAIALRTDLKAPMIPVHTTIKGPDPDLPERAYQNRIAIGIDMTPGLMAAILAEAVDEAARDATELVMKITHEIDAETTHGTRTIRLDEDVFFPRGTVGRAMQRSRGVMMVAALLSNDFEVARIQGIRQTLRAYYGAPVETLENLRVADDEVRAGEVLDLELTLRGYQGESRREVVPIRIPLDAADQSLAIEVAGGDVERPYRAIPANLDDLIGNLEAGYPSRSLVVTVYRQGEGLSTRQGLLPSLPDSVLETLVDRGGTRSSVRLKQMSRRVLPRNNIVEGVHSIRVHVLPPKTP